MQGTPAGQVSYIDQLYGLLAGMVFLTINGHHSFLQALRASFSILPLPLVHFAPSFTHSRKTL